MLGLLRTGCYLVGNSFLPCGWAVGTTETGCRTYAGSLYLCNYFVVYTFVLHEHAPADDFPLADRRICAKRRVRRKVALGDSLPLFKAFCFRFVHVRLLVFQLFFLQQFPHGLGVAPAQQQLAFCVEMGVAFIEVRLQTFRRNACGVG